MKITAAEVRAKYPEPVASNGPPEGYCIGGALCGVLSDHRASLFPSDAVLAMNLRRANECLTLLDSTRRAKDIIWLNDAKDFEAAWQALDEALTYGQKP